MPDAITVMDVDFKTLAGERSHDVRAQPVVQHQKQRCRRRTPVAQRLNQQETTNSVVNSSPPPDTLPPKAHSKT